MFCLSFFTGAMGLDQGLEMAGITIKCACENDKDARATISLNRPNLPLLGDIMQLSASDVLNTAGISADQVFLICGGPPCQSFSTAGKRQAFEDPRGNAFIKFIQLSLEINPQYILIENVRGLLSAGTPKGSAIKYVMETLERSGYTVSFNLYNAANFGVPQQRERMILIASRNGRVGELVPTHTETEIGLSLWKTFYNAITEPSPLNEQEAEFLPFPAKRLQYYTQLGPGQNWRSLPEHLQREALGGAFESSGGKSGFLRRLSWNKPSPTLLTSPTMPATDLCHPSLNRPLSVQEYKRLQQFPDTFQLSGDTRAKYRQLGNAVPVGLGFAAGVAILRSAGYLPESTTNVPQNFKHSRYNNTNDRAYRNTSV